MKLMLTRQSISKDMVKTACPLMLSILSYPLFAIGFLALITTYFPTHTSHFIIAQTVVIIAIRCCESLLSGTRVLTAQKIHETSLVHHKILNTSLITGFGLSLIVIASSAIFWALCDYIAPDSYYSSLSATIFLLTLGVPGNFVYNSCSYYLHAQKNTYLLPIASWIANVLGYIGMHIYGQSSCTSFYGCLFIAALSRCLLGLLAYLTIPKDKKDGTLLFKGYRIQNTFEICKFGVSYTFYSLMFTASYFVFAVLLEHTAPQDLATYQIQMNLLNIFSVINVTLASSGCIIMASVHKSHLVLKKMVISQNFFVNMIIVLGLLTAVYVLREEILNFMGKSQASLPLFHHTFFIFSAIYIFDLLQTIQTQIMTYNNDYIVPPLVRMTIFAIISIPLAYISTSIFHLGLEGLLISILIATIASSLFTMHRFFQSHIFFSPQTNEV